MTQRARRVGIVGASADPNSGYVLEAVRRQGGEPVLIETDAVPEGRALSWHDGEVRFAGAPLHELSVFYVKTIYLSLPVIDPAQLPRRNFHSWQEQYAAERERHSFITSVLRALRERRGGRAPHFVNPVESFDLHFLKLHQLARLSAAGIPVPATLATCDPAAVRGFVERHRHVIYKPLSGGAAVEKLTAEDLTQERLALLPNCPVLFQEQLQGEEFRCYLLAGEPVAAFQIPTDGAADARHNLARATPAELPREVWELCARAARALGLIFTAVDLRRTPDGRCVPLELNPTPAISFFEDPVNGRVIRALADHLVRHA